VACGGWLGTDEVRRVKRVCFCEVLNSCQMHTFPFYLALRPRSRRYVIQLTNLMQLGGCRSRIAGRGGKVDHLFIVTSKTYHISAAAVALMKRESKRLQRRRRCILAYPRSEKESRYFLLAPKPPMQRSSFLEYFHGPSGPLGRARTGDSNSSRAG
jgi:hypothetical protein